MRICENGIYRDLTGDEIKKLTQIEPEQSAELSPEERLINLENAMQDLILMTLGGK